MSRLTRRSVGISAIALMLTAMVSPLPSHVAAADPATPGAPTILPEQTAAPTPAPPTIAPTSLPTVISEGPSPETTIAATPFIPTIGPESTPTPNTETIPSPGPVSTSTASTVVIPPPAATPVVAPWPSPDQLRQNARLRWGNGIPASVRRWAFLVVPAARTYHIDPNLIAAVMTMESNGDPLALSPADARGLMQILHGPWDPRTNVDIGAHMLSDLHTQFGDWSLALAAYNAGPGAVESAGGVPPFRETRDYVVVVEYLWDLYGHRHLSFARRTQYRRTLGDLSHFKDQRKKVAKLARIAHVADLSLSSCALGACIGASPAVPVTVLDPFWPAGGSPDPLQQIGPISADGVLAGSRN